MVTQETHLFNDTVFANAFLGVDIVPMVKVHNGVSHQKHTPASNTPFRIDMQGHSFQGNWNYTQVVRILLHLASTSHPNAQFLVHQCACFRHSPKVSHASRLQTETALSTLLSKYTALSTVICELIPLQRVLQEVGQALNLEFSKPSIVQSTCFQDNNGALGLALTPRLTPRTKHTGVKYHFFKSMIRESKGIMIRHIDPALQKADIFTEGLSQDTSRVGEYSHPSFFIDPYTCGREEVERADDYRLSIQCTIYIYWSVPALYTYVSSAQHTCLYIHIYMYEYKASSTGAGRVHRLNSSLSTYIYISSCMNTRHLPLEPVEFTD